MQESQSQNSNSQNKEEFLENLQDDSENEFDLTFFVNDIEESESSTETTVQQHIQQQPFLYQQSSIPASNINQVNLNQNSQTPVQASETFDWTEEEMPLKTDRNTPPRLSSLEGSSRLSGNQSKSKSQTNINSHTKNSLNGQSSQNSSQNQPFNQSQTNPKNTNRRHQSHQSNADSNCQSNNTNNINQPSTLDYDDHTNTLNTIENSREANSVLDRLQGRNNSKSSVDEDCSRSGTRVIHQ